MSEATLPGAAERATQDALDEPYCLSCRRAAWKDHNWKYIGVGGFLTGPFCSRECQFTWLLEDDDD
ncbi:hypothetical protein [Haloferax sp. Atlit-12N]|uniref:hypothetical protein n=1 Tax=Haloferax sp. Atlit-12N TaxID=2077203 RepID=UPI0011E5F766|nr:hypothetical protein [Haloferax sp. Atlit-12N]